MATSGTPISCTYNYIFALPSPLRSCSSLLLLHQGRHHTLPTDNRYRSRFYAVGSHTGRTSLTLPTTSLIQENAPEKVRMMVYIKDKTINYHH